MPDDAENIPAHQGVTKAVKRSHHASPHYNTRKRASSAVALATATKMGIDPIKWALNAIKSGVVSEVVIAPDGTKTRQDRALSAEALIDLVKHVTRYCYPMLASAQVTGDGGGPIEIVRPDISALLANPEAFRAAQTVALALAAQPSSPAPAIQDPGPRLQTPEPRDLTLDFQKTATGHWRPK